MTEILDKSAGKCIYCGKQLDPAIGKWHGDHVIPKSQGGGRGGNIWPTCPECNTLKNSMTPEQFRRGFRLNMMKYIRQIGMALNWINNDIERSRRYPILPAGSDDRIQEILAQITVLLDQLKTEADPYSVEFWFDGQPEIKRVIQNLEANRPPAEP